MNADRVRTLLLGLPQVVETEQWGGLVYWVGDKAVGGKMFAMVNPVGAGELPISYAAGEERFHELLELEGMRPAPYLARAFWVAVERWDALRDREWERELEAARELTFAKLPLRTQKMLALPKPELKSLVAERRKLLAARAATKKVEKEKGDSPGV